MTNTSKNLMKQNQQKLGIVETIAFSLGFFAYSMVNLGFSTYLTYFWSDIFIIPLGVISTIFLISRLLDGGTDLLVGFWVDRTSTKYGKARPWLLWMSLPSALSLMLLYYVPNLSESGKITWAFITYNLVAFFFMTCINLPLQSLNSLITSEPKQRLTLNMVAQAFSTLGIILGNMFVLDVIKALGGGTEGYFKFFAIMGGGSFVLVILTFLGTKEKVKPTIKKKKHSKLSIKQALSAFIANKWWMLVTLLMGLSMLYPSLMAINVYYMQWIMGDISLMGSFMSIVYGAMLGALIIATPIIGKIGKINAGFIGMVIQITGGLLPLFAPGNIMIMMISAALRGIGPAILLGTRLAFMCDVVEYGEWKTGIRVEGLVFSGASFGSKIGTGVGGAIVALMLAYGGYVGGAAIQSETALSAITFTFTWVHALDSLLITICLFFLRGLEKQMPQIIADLEARKASS